MYLLVLYCKMVALSTVLCYLLENYKYKQAWPAHKYGWKMPFVYYCLPLLKFPTRHNLRSIMNFLSIPSAIHGRVKLSLDDFIYLFIYVFIYFKKQLFSGGAVFMFVPCIMLNFTNQKILHIPVQSCIRYRYSTPYCTVYSTYRILRALRSLIMVIE